MMIQLGLFSCQGNRQTGGARDGGEKKDEKVRFSLRNHLSKIIYFKVTDFFQDKKKKYEPPVPTRIGKKKKRTKGPESAYKLPQVLPHTRCRLKLLRTERIKDYLLMEEEFITNQERLKPQEEKNEVEISR